MARGDLSKLVQEISEIDTGIPQRTLQGVAVDLLVKRKDDGPPVRMAHLDMTAPTMNFDEAQAFKRPKHLVS